MSTDADQVDKPACSDRVIQDYARSGWSKVDSSASSVAITFSKGVTIPPSNGVKVPSTNGVKRRTDVESSDAIEGTEVATHSKTYR